MQVLGLTLSRSEWSGVCGGVVGRRIWLIGKEVAGEKVESTGHCFEVLVDSCLPFGESGLQVGQTLFSGVWRDHVGAAGVIRRKRHGRGEFWRSDQ